MSQKTRWRLMNETGAFRSIVSLSFGLPGLQSVPAGNMADTATTDTAPKAASQRKSRRRRWGRRVIAVALLLFALTAVDYFAYPYGAWKTGRTGNRGENGLW